MKLVIEVNLDNAAFVDEADIYGNGVNGFEVKQVLSEVGNKIANGRVDGIVNDSNGNKAAIFKIVGGK